METINHIVPLDHNCKFVLFNFFKVVLMKNVPQLELEDTVMRQLIVIQLNIASQTSVMISLRLRKNVPILMNVGGELHVSLRHQTSSMECVLHISVFQRVQALSTSSVL
jgi:hypothetical protein